MGATKTSVIQDNNNILLNRKQPVLARTHLYTAQTTIRRVLANNEYAKNIPAIVNPFLAFNQEVHNILYRIVEIPPYDALQILSAIISTLYYWEIYEACAFSLVVEIAFLFKKFHECGYRRPTWLRLIVKGNYISNRECPAFPKEVHYFFFTFC